MSKLKVLNSSYQDFEVPIVINDVLTSPRTEVINSDNIISFSMILTSENKDWINDTNTIGLGTDLFDIAKYKKAQVENGELAVSVECEHVSYQLNNPDYDKEYFTKTGTPAYVFGQILDGTPFTDGTVEFTDAVTYSIQEKMSRRAMVVQFAEYLGGELSFDGFTISILSARGSATPKDLMAGKNITVISKEVDKTKRDELGNPTVAYECALIYPMALALGDVVTLDYDTLGIDVSLRIVSITTNPYNQYEVSFSVSNTVPAIEDAAYDIATTTVSKDAVYNGCRIGPEFGFEVVLSDNYARSFFNSIAFKMQVGDGGGVNWTDAIYFDAVAKKYKFVGDIIMEGGSISWWDLEEPPTINDIVNLATMMTYIDETGVYTGTLVAQQIYGLLLEAVTIKAGKIVGDANSAILYIGENGGSIDTAFNEVNSIRLKPGGTNCGYLQVIENGEVYFYSNDGSGIDFASIREDGYYLGDLKIAGVVEGEIILTVPQVWVQADEPTEAKEEDLWIDTDDYSRYDKTDISSNTTLEAYASEFIKASGTITITLHAATQAGIIKKIYNTGTGIVTIAGTINGVTNMYLYPNESIELITDGTAWRH